MKFIRKSMGRKMTLLLVSVLMLLGGGYVFLNQSSVDLIPVEWVFAGFGVFLVMYVIAFYLIAVKPLGVVLSEVKLLLTGRQYHRIYSKRVDEVGILAHFFNEVTKNIEKISAQLKEGERMMSELEIASKIQRDVMPKDNPSIPGLDVVAKTRPAAEVGGDSFDYISKRGNHYFYVGDVTGHGVPAGLVMMMVNTLLETYSELFDTAKEIVVNTNTQLKPRIKATMFMTMVFFKWDPDTGKMSYVGAGHEYIVVYRAATGEVEAFPAGGIALGMIPNNMAVTKEVEIEFNKGDVILLFTDGIIEAKRDDGEMYGLERLKESFKKHAPMYSSEGIVFHVANDFSRFVGSHAQEDDITLMSVKHAIAEKASEGNSSTELEVASEAV